MPEAIDSIELTFVNDGSIPLNSVALLVPIRTAMLHTVRARMDVGGTMTTGQVRIFDQADLALGPKDEALLYDSGVVACAGPSVEKTNKPIIIVTPTAATGAWTVTVRITTSRS